MEIEEFLLKNPTFDVSDLIYGKNEVFGPEMLKLWDKNLKTGVEMGLSEANTGPFCAV